MKLRLTEEDIRFRVDKDDIASFIADGFIEASTQIGTERVFRYGIYASDEVENISAVLKEDGITVHVPSGIADEWAHTDRIGLQGQQRQQQEHDVTILIEKDLGCRHDSPPQPHSGTFSR